jgi:thiamine biosynthesis lipoprotein
MEAALEHERRFDLFGSHVRLLVGAPVDDRLPSPPVVAMQVEGFLRTVHARLTRFDRGSELSRLNDDHAPIHAASPLLALAVRAALWAARETGGLVDPVVLDSLQRAGYAHSRAGLAPAPLPEALDAAPPRSRAWPRQGSPWSQFEVDPATGTIARPPGARIDLGGTAKGLAADLAAERLAGYGTFCVDAGGDLRLGGDRPLSRVVEVRHPLGDAPSYFDAAAGAVATSGLATRIWRLGDGYSHHLIDPSTGAPAWTGVVQATARGRTGVEAEALAKAALLSGPAGARELLAERGGAIVLDDGAVERFGPLLGDRSAAEVAA